MRRIATIYLVMWPWFRSMWHVFDTTNYPALKHLYFYSVDASIAGLFAILLYVVVHGVRPTQYVSVSQFKSLVLWLFIYSFWCYLVDSLMVLGIGDKDSAIYTGGSITLLIIPWLWIFVLKHLVNLYRKLSYG
jgi:hypothetical protein